MLPYYKLIHNTSFVLRTRPCQKGLDCFTNKDSIPMVGLLLLLVVDDVFMSDSMLLK